MNQNIKRIFEKQGFIRLKGVLDYKEDLEPILNDMAFIMDRLIPVSYTHLTLPTICSV